VHQLAVHERGSVTSGLQVGIIALATGTFGLDIWAKTARRLF